MDNESSTNIDWAGIIDLLASEYGWTIDYIKYNLDLGQVITLKNTIQKRYARENGENSEVSSDNETVPKSEDNINISEFEKIGGKKRIREDGVTEIIF